MSNVTPQEQPRSLEDVMEILPKYYQKTSVWINGAEVPNVRQNIAPDQHIQNIRKLPIRDDDVLVTAYPKSGTHWTWEIVQMLRNRTTVHEKRTKENVMLEFCPTSDIDRQSSPRILNTHLYMAHLPEEIFDKKTKIIHVVRNPKDVLTSLYHHVNQFCSLTFQEFLNVMEANLITYDTQWNFLRMMDNLQKQHPDQPVLLVYYEHMKKDPVGVTKSIANFLDLDVTDKFCEEVAMACGFQHMKRADTTKELPKVLVENRKTLGVDQVIIYRKGTVGDWKNQFSVAQNEDFDALVHTENKDLHYKFTYE